MPHSGALSKDVAKLLMRKICKSNACSCKDAVRRKATVLTACKERLSKDPIGGQLGCRPMELLEILRGVQAPCRRTEKSIPGLDVLPNVLKRVCKSARPKMGKVAERCDASLLRLTDDCSLIVHEDVGSQPQESVRLPTPAQPLVYDFDRGEGDSSCRLRVLQNSRRRKSLAALPTNDSMTRLIGA